MALRKIQDSQVDLSGANDNEGDNNKQEKILDLREENKEAAEEKMPILDLHSDNGEKVEDNAGVLAEIKSEHRRKFEERLARMEQEEKINKQEKVEKTPPALFDSANEEAGQVAVEQAEDEEKEIIKEKIDKLEHRLEELEEEEPEANQVQKLVKPATRASRSVQSVETKILAASLPSKPKETLEFPESFLWGTSTSAYQTEGGIVHNWMIAGKLNVVDIFNDWSIWEISKTRKEYLAKKGKNFYDYVCALACDSYNRYQEDLDLAKGLNNNAVRFSLEWSRIELQKETIDIKAINHYRDLMREAKKRGLKTVVTLWHWTNPLWFAAEGGWAGKQAVDYYLRYVDLVIKEFGSYIDYWVTLNEPMVHAANGYLKGKFPPNKKNVFQAARAFNNLAYAHCRAYEKIHEHFPQAQVSITKLASCFEPAHAWCPIEWSLAKIYNYFANSLFLNKIKNHADYIGLDYYFHNQIVWYPPFKRNRNKKITDMGWEIYPEGIYQVLKYLSKYKKPILILENGLADEEDKYRADFIKEHLYYIHKAIKEGVDVRGYFYWSLLDNFEWAEGYGPKFGLYAVDRQTFKRTPRPSAQVYADICKNNKVEVDV